MAEPTDLKLYPTITRTEFNYIGKSGLRRKEGLAKASGRAKYTRDVILEGMLYAKPLYSPYAHAKIKSVDKSKAEALPGVKAVVTPFDPDVKDVTFSENTPAKTTTGPLFRDEVHHYRDRAGVWVVADSELICEEALRLIKVEWEELPWVIDWDAALAPGAPLLYPAINPKDNIKNESTEEHGDVEKGFTEADHIIEWTIKAGTSAIPVEPFTCVARWSGDQLELWLKAQMGPGPRALKNYCVQFTPICNITGYSLYQGATFGGGSRGGATLSTFAAFLSKKVGRPVKVVHEMEGFEVPEQMQGTYKYKAGYKNDGTITAIDINYFRATGGLLWIWKDTKTPNMRSHLINPFMSQANTTCFKHGSPFSSVSILVKAHVADALGMDPTKVALINDGSKGNDMAWVDENVKKVQGFPLVDSLKMCLDAGKKAMDWDNKWHAPSTKILPNGKYHGLGFMSMHDWTYDLGGKGSSYGGVVVQADGSVNLLMQLNDHGVNQQSTYCQVVADELGVKYADVDANMQLDYAFYGHDSGCGGACISDSMTFAKASRQLKKQILEQAVTDAISTGTRGKASFPGLKPGDLDIKESIVFEKAKPENKKTLKEVVTAAWAVGGTGFGVQPAFSWSWTKNPDTRGSEKEEMTHFPMNLAMWCMTRQASFVEVEVDPETGKADITNFVAVNDVGKVISPEGVTLQQMAGGWAGLGRSLTLDYISDPQTGVRLNDDHIQYPILLMNDSKLTEAIAVESGLGYGPYGSAGLGECNVAVATALIVPAVYNAIGKWVDMPCTPDKILKALGKG